MGEFEYTVSCTEPERQNIREIFGLESQYASENAATLSN